MIPKITYKNTIDKEIEAALPLSFPVEYVQDDNLANEEYKLTIMPEKIEIASSTEAGRYYGMQTLVGLIKENDGRLQCGTINEAPRYGYRGVLFDVCRHFFDVNQVKHVIDLIADLKFNHLHLHLSDDQGFRIESKKFPLLNQIGSLYEDENGDKVGGYYTQEEIKDIVEYASQRMITIVPEIDLPGHTTAIIASYPEFSCSKEPLPVANVPGIHKRIVCAGKAETLPFLYELLDEMTALFPGKYFHIGGDEAPKDEWKVCPDCQRLIKEKGLKDEEALQGYFTGLLGEHLKKCGKEMIGWNEILKSGQTKDAIAQYYVEFEDSYSYGRALEGQRFILSNECSMYMDYDHLLIPLKATYDYDQNIQGHYDIPDESVLGIEAALWTENVATVSQIERQLFPRLLAVAENAWCREKDYEDFKKRADLYLQQLKEAGVNFVPLDEADHHGEQIVERVADAMGKRLFFLGRGIPEPVARIFSRAIMQMMNNMKSYGVSEEECLRGHDLVIKYLTTE